MTEPASTPPPVTIAVVSWNTRGLLADCLNSLREDVTGGLADVWVVDNASSDGSAGLVRERFPWVSLIHSKENLGFGSAVNLVAARTRSRWIVPANADVRVSPGGLARLLAVGERHPEAALIAPRLILPNGATQHSVYPFPTIPFTFAYAVGALRINRRLSRRWCIDGGFDPDRRREVPWAVGAFLLVRRSAWDEVGGFDEEHWMYAEDLDLAWRLRRAGWSARYEPESHVYHTESAAARQAWGNERYTRWHESTYAWLARRRGVGTARLIAALYVGGFLARAVVYTFASLAGSQDARLGRRDALTAARVHAIGLRSQAVPPRGQVT